jgi:hypothetical protein
MECMGRPIHSVIFEFNKEVVVKNKHINIRTIIGKHFSDLDYGNVVNLLNRILTKKDHTVKVSEDTSISFINIDQSSYSINGDVYMYGDVKSALREFLAISLYMGRDVGFVSDSVFGKGNKKVYETPELAGMVHNLVMKRYYNWHRPGSDKDITIKLPNGIGYLHLSHFEKTNRISVTENLEGLRFQMVVEKGDAMSSITYSFIPARNESVIEQPDIESLIPIVPLKEHGSESKVTQVTAKKESSFFSNLLSRFKLDKVFG